jgi:CrcB protein
VERIMNTPVVNCLAIGGAGFVGALTRYGIVRLFAPWVSGQSFPWATMVINVSGSAFLGWFLTVITKRAPGPNTETLKLAIATGFVGAYTTFSTYMFETNDLISKGSTYQAFGYLIGSLILGLIGVRFGVIIGRI